MQGCYIGQETLSKLSNLDAVKQQLWGLDLSAPASVGDEVSGMPPCHESSLITHTHHLYLLLQLCQWRGLLLLQMARQRLGS